MPAFPEEPEIHESIPGRGVPFPRESDAHAPRTPSAGSESAASVESAPAVPGRAVPGPRPAPPRPVPPRVAVPGPSARVVPGPKPAPSPKPSAKPSPKPGLKPPIPGPQSSQLQRGKPESGKPQTVTARGAEPRIPVPGPGPRRPAPAVQVVSATVQDAVERADDAVDQLLESGRRPADILVLTVGEPHPWQQHELSFGEDRYWAQLAEGGDVFYADAAEARPLRREVVVLVANDGSTERVERAARTALGLAGSLLVVCGRPEAVAPVVPGGSRPVPA